MRKQVLAPETGNNFENDAINLLREFYSKTSANEIHELLSLMLDSYIQSEEFERLQLANLIKLMNDFQKLAFDMEILGIRQIAFEQLATVNQITS